jgi:hypothetical protein
MLFSDSFGQNTLKLALVTSCPVISQQVVDTRPLDCGQLVDGQMFCFAIVYSLWIFQENPETVNFPAANSLYPAHQLWKLLSVNIFALIFWAIAHWDEGGVGKRRGEERVCILLLICSVPRTLVAVELPSNDGNEAQSSAQFVESVCSSADSARYARSRTYKGCTHDRNVQQLKDHD